MTFHVLDLVRAATVGAVGLSGFGLAVSIDTREPVLIAWNGVLIVLEAAYFVWVSRVRRRELA